MRFAQLNLSNFKLSLEILVAATLLSSLSACQQVQKATITRHEMNPPWEEINGYTQVVEVNGTVYLSGVACSGKNYAEAIPDCYRQLKVQLDKLKLTPKNIVKETIFTRDIEALKEQVPARKAFYGTHYPAATWIEIKRLFMPEMVVEVDVIAVRTE